MISIFEINEGKTDRIIRFVVGVVLVALGLIYQGTWSIVALVVGVIAIITALTGFCLLYKLFGVNTNITSKGNTKKKARK